MSESKPTARHSEVVSEIGPKAVVPLWLIQKASGTALRVFAYLDAAHADKHAQAFPARSTIGRELSLSVDTVDRALQELKSLNALTWETRPGPGKSKSTNLYRLLFIKPKDEAEGSRTDAGTSKNAATPYPQKRGKGSRTDAAVNYSPTNHVSALNHPEPETMDRPLDETVPTSYLDPLSTPAKSNFAGSTPGYKHGRLKPNASPEARHERAERDARRRLTEAEATYNRANQRNDVSPTAETKRALAEADAAYRTAAQAVRELEREPDTPVPRSGGVHPDSKGAPPQFVDRAVSRLG